jgi:hypothetical protein
MVRAGGLPPSGRIVSKFPAGYYDRLQAAFRAFFEAYTPEQLDTRQLYNLYDQWKKACAAGRLVDLDKLIAWCEERKPPARKKKGKGPASAS